jgi:hypothetical protein
MPPTTELNRKLILQDEYVHLKNEVLRVHAENLLLESYLEPESSVEDANGK